MALLAQASDFTDRDFDALRLRLQSLVRSVFPEWTDFNVANFGNLLLELYAFVGDVLAFYQDNQARESRIATATQRKNLIALTKLLGFRPAGARAATADVLFRLTAPPTAAVTLPKLTGPISCEFDITVAPQWTSKTGQRKLKRQDVDGGGGGGGRGMARRRDGKRLERASDVASSGRTVFDALASTSPPARIEGFRYFKFAANTGCQPGRHCMHSANIAVVETFIQALERKSTAMMPLDDDVILITPLAPDQVVRGKQAMVEFLDNLFPKFEVVGTKIERHLTVGSSVCTLWEMTFYPNATLRIFDYMEVKLNKLTVVRPYFDPTPLLNIMGGDR